MGFDASNIDKVSMEQLLEFTTRDKVAGRPSGTYEELTERMEAIQDGLEAMVEGRTEDCQRAAAELLNNNYADRMPEEGPDEQGQQENESSRDRAGQPA